MRYTLIDGQGNFGSIEGDSPAAYRYTESRLTKVSERFLQDIEKEVVNFNPNFDGTHTEPQVLPSLIPNLLVNGSSGIAVGMATSIPPHNLGEVIDCVIKVIDEPEITTDDLVNLNLVKGPDFPTKANLVNREDLKKFYLSGEGSFTIKAVCSFEDITKSKQAIIIEEIPYQINFENLINQMIELVKSGKIKDITDIRNETNKKGIRIVIELKSGIDPNIILNQLYKHTSLQTKISQRECYQLLMEFQRF